MRRLWFGRAAAQDCARLVSGWSAPEDGFTWSIGAESVFDMPMDVSSWPGSIFLELDLNPFVAPGNKQGQTLQVFANGIPIGADRVVGEGTVAYAIPDQAFGDARSLRIRLRTPQSARPVDIGCGPDGRMLGFMLRSAALVTMPQTASVPRRTLPPLALPNAREGSVLAQALFETCGLDAASLLGGFESLGHNCEFGMAQRHAGAEPLGLLRFAGITFPDLLLGLQSGFDGVGRSEQLEILVADGVRREFILHDTRHRLSLHTRRFADETDAHALRTDSERHLAFLRRKFLEDLSDTDKIFVCQRPGQLLQAQAIPILSRLRAYGSTALLFVVEGDEHPPGTVEELGYGFFRGWNDQMAPQENVGFCNLAAWLSNCANARRLWAVQRATGSMSPIRKEDPPTSPG